MRINSFYHVNNIAAGADLRPDWRCLAQLGDTSKILKYCDDKGIKRLVLLEDFIGCGSQMAEAVEHAATLSPALKTLVVPLIICPAGVETIRALELKHPTALRFEPILSIPKTAFVTPVSTPNEPQLHVELRDFATQTYDLVSEGKPIGPDKPYHPLGYPHSEPSGGLIVMFSNTPDNTLPLIHWPSSQWSPLFPRHSRV
jgi:hypothetical protein